MSFTIAFLAMFIERFLPLSFNTGGRFSHPVQWQGSLIAWLENRLNNSNKTANQRRFGGMMMLIILLAVTLGASMLVLWLIGFLPFSWIFEAIIASVLLAYRGLKKAVIDVAKSLDISLKQARKQVSHIVGRDTKNLDEHEISRAAIESLAENSSDGVIAPLFWLALLGLPGIAIYKAINTADSMVGHLNERYGDFGWASAKIDDLANWLPARLSAIFYALAARFVAPGMGAKSWMSAINDAPKHVSPNAGWPEAALAGALGFGLGGPRNYNGKTLDLPEMGQGRRDLVSGDILRSLQLYSVMVTIALVFTGLLALAQIWQFTF